MRTAVILLAILSSAAIARAAPPPDRPRPRSLADCDAQVAAAPRTLAAYRCYWYVARNHNLLQPAARRLESLQARHPGDPRIQLILGVLAADLGQPRAEQLFRAAASGFRAEGDAEGEVHSRVSLAILFHYQGRVQEGEAELMTAAARADRAGDPELQAEVRVNLAWQRFYERRYGLALKLFEEGETLVFPDGSIYNQLKVVDGLAAVAWALQRNGEALDGYRREAALLRGSDPFREAWIRRNIALIARSLFRSGRIDRDAALRYGREALAAALRSGNRQAEVGARLALSQALEGAEGVAEAERALRLARQSPVRGDIGWALELLGAQRLDLAPDRPAEAFAAVDEAVELAGRRDDPEGLAQAMVTRAFMRWKSGPRAQAKDEIRAALDAVERIRGIQPKGDVRSRVFSRFADDYRRLAALLLGSTGPPPATEDLQQAWEILERLRARTLLETLDAAGAGSHLPAPHPLPNPKEPPSISVIQRALAPDQALLSFLLSPGDTGSWVILVTPSVVHLLPLPDSGALETRIGLFRALLERRDRSERRAGEVLFQELLAPALAQLPVGTTRLVLIPDGPLHQLPFAALRPPPRSDGSTEACGLTYELTQVPSAATWLHWRKQEIPTGPASLLALADPLFPLAEPTPSGAPPPSTERKLPLRPLPFARREAQALSRQLGGESLVWIGMQANETALKTVPLSRYRVIHIAAHALADEEDPALAALVLAPTRDRDDGLLRFPEAAALGLKGQMVILSACRSGSGPVIGGEGVVGLAQAFFHAGSRTVVAGLWPLRDDETAFLIEQFGRGLSRGCRPADALTRARRAAQKRGMPPAAWAGLVLLGDGDTVLFPQAPKLLPLTLMISAAAAGAACAILFVSRRRLLKKSSWTGNST